MSNPLLTPAQNAHIEALRSNSHPTPTPSGVLAYLRTRDYSKAYQLVTNGLGLLAVLFYAVNFSNVMASNNHIYAVYQLFPVIASLAIVTTLWTAPANSLLRVLYIVGLYTISWMGV